MTKKWLQSMGSTRRRLLGVGAAAMTLASVAGGAAVIDSAHAASPCASGTAVGQYCHYVGITTAGPNYEAWMSIVDLEGNDERVYNWHERKQRYTTWWWRYDSTNIGPSDPVNFKLKLKIQSLDNPRIGWEGFVSASADSCFNWETVNDQPRVSRVSCPENSTPAGGGSGVVLPGDFGGVGGGGVGPANP